MFLKNKCVMEKMHDCLCEEASGRERSKKSHWKVPRVTACCRKLNDCL